MEINFYDDDYLWVKINKDDVFWNYRLGGNWVWGLVNIGEGNILYKKGIRRLG